MPPTATDERRARRMRGFRLHVILFMAALLVMIAANFVLMPSYPWWILFAVGWGAPLAVHCAYAMELFGPRE